MAGRSTVPRGYVVEHKENGIRYAVSPHNYNPDIHKKIRELRPYETTWGFAPKYVTSKADKPAEDPKDPSAAPVEDN